jgi:hypothetical protein
MLEELFFALGLVNNLALIGIFLIRGTRGTGPLQRIGPAYLLLTIPAVYGVLLVSEEQKSVQYSIFLGIFLAYLALEGLYDFVWKLPFRQNWKLAAPYLCLYFAMNYGFVAMVWKTALAWGLVLLALFIVQIVVNMATHPPGRVKKATRGDETV